MDFCAAEGLLGMLEIMPLRQSNWVFDRDDNFAYTRRPSDQSGTPAANPTLDFETWTSGWGCNPVAYRSRLR